MDIHDLKIFLMIAQEGSVSKLCSLHIPICYQCVALVVYTYVRFMGAIFGGKK